MFGLKLENHYARLPEAFYTRMRAESVGRELRLLHANAGAAELIGLDAAAFNDPRFVQVFSGRLPLDGFAPLAMIYSGHQFGVWAGRLGDGRALLIGQVRNARGELWDIQLKGAGKTPYSRSGDGRAVLRSSIREYLCSEAMAALGVPSTRALALVASGETVMREAPEPGAVITRLAQSHIRFGHFEHFHYIGDEAGLRTLADHVIAEHFTALAGDYAAWFATVVERTAHLMAHWQAIGFAHGVMNTDNMSILGLTLDYGPFGFMETYDPHFVCNHTDVQGRYSFINQPGIAHWNLRALAVALSRIIPAEKLTAALDTFEPSFAGYYRTLMRAKLGLTREEEGDDRLIGALLAAMARGRADYTLTFRELPRANEIWLARFGAARAEAQAWLGRYRARMVHEDLAAMDRINPQYVLRNWVAQTAIHAVQSKSDIATFNRIFRLMKTPFDDHPGDEAFAAPPPPHMCGLEVSCSS